MFYAKRVSKVVLNTRQSRVLCGTGESTRARGSLAGVKNCAEAAGSRRRAVAGLRCVYGGVTLEKQIGSSKGETFLFCC